jgi:hypothetical protein
MRDNFAAIGQAAMVNATARAQTVPNLTLVVSAFDYVGATGVRGSYAGGNSPALTGPTTNPRIALLTFTPATATFGWTYGAEAASPAPPAYPFGVIPIVEVYCRVGLASITNTDTGTNGYILRLAPRVGPFDNPLTGVGDLIVGATAGLPSRLPPAATGQVLISQGASAAPVWSTDPAIRNLLVQGGAVGTSGVGVLALGPAGAPSPPTTSPVDTVQLYTIDLAGGEAGSRGLALRDERGGITEIGSSATLLNLTQRNATVVMAMQASMGGGNIGTVSNHGLTILQNNANAINVATDGSIYFSRPLIIQNLNGLQIGTGQFQLTYTTADAFLTLNPTGGHQYQFIGSGTGSGLGPGTFTLWDVTAGSVIRLAWTSAGDLNLGVSGLQARQVSTGAPDSGGPGFRTLRIAN